eukprot:7444677-Alexandrium_andersonii.AAC.1
MCGQKRPLTASRIHGRGGNTSARTLRPTPLHLLGRLSPSVASSRRGDRRWLVGVLSVARGLLGGAQRCEGLARG